jgi:hypothetical protein
LTIFAATVVVTFRFSRTVVVVVGATVVDGLAWGDGETATVVVVVVVVVGFDVISKDICVAVALL